MASASEAPPCFDLPDAPDDIDLSFLDGLLDGTLELPADEPLLQSTSQVFEAEPSSSVTVHGGSGPTPASSNGSAPRSPTPSTSGCNAPIASRSGTTESLGCSARSDGTGHDHEDAAKKAARMQRNRESAHFSRQRKKMQAAELEQQNAELTAQNKHLNGLVSQLASENMVLKQQLVAVCQATNTALPAIPGLILAHPTMATPMHPHFGTLSPLSPLSPMVPKVPLQRLEKPARPAPAPKAPAPKAPAAAAGKRSRAAGGGASKRSKTVAAAGTTMLAVFSLATLFLCTTPFTSSLGGGVPTEHYAALPGVRQSSGHLALLGGDGVAAAGPGGGAAAAAGGAQPPPAAAWAANATAAWAANATALLVPEHLGGELAGKTLQHLQDVSSTALVWQPQLAQQHPGLLQLLPQWESLPTLLGAPLAADGLLSPLTCDKVFEVDASSLPDAEKLRQRIDRYVASLEGFRGRAMPLPPVGGAQGGPHGEEHGESVGGKRGGRVLGGQGDMLVSVVLPVKEGGKEGSGMLRALDRLFVVLLQQSAVYATYSCQLPKVGFL